MKLKSHIPIEIDIGEGEKLALGVKRLTLQEAAELRAKYQEAKNAQEKEADDLWSALITDCFKRFVRLECEVVIELADGEVKLRKAEELLEFFGGRIGLLVNVVLSVLAQSSLSAEKKMRLLSHTASSPSSDEPEKEAPGPKPETTAASAGDGASATIEDATAPETTPSGSTDEAKTEDPPSSSENAPSLA